MEASRRQEEIRSRDVDLKKVQWKLWVSGPVLLALCLYWITNSVNSLRGARFGILWTYNLFGSIGLFLSHCVYLATASDIGTEYETYTVCWIAPFFYGKLLPISIAHFLTRCPHAKPKTMSDVTSRTRAASGTSVENSPQSKWSVPAGGAGSDDPKVPAKSAPASGDDDGTNGNVDEGRAENET